MARKKIALIGGGQIGGVLAQLSACVNWATWFFSISSKACHKARPSISLRHHLSITLMQLLLVQTIMQTSKAQTSSSSLPVFPVNQA